MFDKLMKYLGIGVNDTNFELDKNIPQKQMIKKFNGIILEKKENELIIGSETNKSLKMRMLIVEKNFLPNMVYPSLCDNKYCSIHFKEISIRDRIILEFDNELKTDILVPINNINNMLILIDLDVNRKKPEE